VKEKKKKSREILQYVPVRVLNNITETFSKPTDFFDETNIDIVNWVYKYIFSKME
jgi:hypothetical protein